MSNVHVSNPALGAGGEDYLYHFGISKTAVDIPKEFGDVKFVCTGGSPTRMKVYADMFAKENGLTASKNLCSSDRFVMYKTGPVLWVNHGMGTPSLSIMLIELIKLLYYAKTTDVKVFRLGTSGGLGIVPGTVLISSGCVNGELLESHTQYIMGKKVLRPAALDQSLMEQLRKLAGELKIPAEIGKTMTADDFYEGQARLDGAFCDYKSEDKFNFLQKLYDLGVRNIEMEATCFASMLSRANIKAAVVCVVIVNRMKGDQVTLNEKELMDIEMRPYNLVANYIQKHMKHA